MKMRPWLLAFLSTVVFISSIFFITPELSSATGGSKNSAQTYNYTSNVTSNNNKSDSNTNDTGTRNTKSDNASPATSTTSMTRANDKQMDTLLGITNGLATKLTIFFIISLILIITLIGLLIKIIKIIQSQREEIRKLRRELERQQSQMNMQKLQMEEDRRNLHHIQRQVEDGEKNKLSDSDRLWEVLKQLKKEMQNRDMKNPVEKADSRDIQPPVSTEVSSFASKVAAEYNRAVKDTSKRQNFFFSYKNIYLGVSNYDERRKKPNSPPVFVEDSSGPYMAIATNINPDLYIVLPKLGCEIDQNFIELSAMKDVFKLEKYNDNLNYYNGVTVESPAIFKMTDNGWEKMITGRITFNN